ncbi:MAG: peptide deformylase [Armatimonadota bacterium]|jgi:peptide deformylase
MAVRRIVYCGDPVLRRKASRVRRIDDDICSLLDDLAETMLEANGLGLAAAQVGVSTSVVVVRRGADSDEVIELINPRIIEIEGEESGTEGCLSLPTLRGTVVRPTRTAVEAVDRDGEEIFVEGEGMMARCLSHELDHLAGRLFIDAVEADSLCWLRPDVDEEDGYRTEPTTLEEAQEAFERLRARQKGS